MPESVDAVDDGTALVACFEGSVEEVSPVAAPVETGVGLVVFESGGVGVAGRSGDAVGVSATRVVAGTSVVVRGSATLVDVPLVAMLLVPHAAIADSTTKAPTLAAHRLGRAPEC